LHIEIKEQWKKTSRIFTTKAAKMNMKILEALAFEGPLSPYDIQKKRLPTEYYSVINRRIRQLVKNKFVSVVEEKQSLKSSQVMKLYGLTLKGFLVALLFMEYDDRVETILKANKRNIAFCDFFSDVIRRKILTSAEVKEIFLDELREFMNEGYDIIDKISDYFLFKRAGHYILHNARAELNKLPENKAKIIADILLEFRRLSHPETTERFLKPYLTKDSEE
jgi:hypothetical protein